MCPFPSKSTCKSVRIYQLIFRLTEKKFDWFNSFWEGNKTYPWEPSNFFHCAKEMHLVLLLQMAWHNQATMANRHTVQIAKKNLAQCHFVAKSLRYFVLVDCWITWFLTKMTTVFTQNGTGEKSCHFKWQEWIYSACNSSKQILCLR